MANSLDPIFGQINNAITGLYSAMGSLQTAITNGSPTGFPSGKGGAKGVISSSYNMDFYDKKAGAGRISDTQLLNKLLIEQFKYSKKYNSENKKIEENEKKIASLKAKYNDSILENDKLDLAIKKQIQAISEKTDKRGLNNMEARLSRLKSEKAISDENTKKEKEEYSKALKKEEIATKMRLTWDDAKEATKNKAIGVVNKAASGMLDFVKNTISMAFEQDSIMSKLAANYALTKNESFALKKNILTASIETAAWGVNTEDLVKMQSTYTDELGRSVMLGEDGMTSLAKMGVATGIGVEGAAQMAGEMELFGISAEDAAASVENLMQSSKKVGVSASVATKKLNDNLKISNSYTFKNGVQGVKDMTIYSTKFRINMQSIATLADKISSPEGAIETAANLQVLGGSFAQMADPLKMLDQGINDMEGLTQTYKKMLDGVAKINSKTGDVVVGGYDRLRVKAAAAAMGVSFDEMMESARTIAKRSAIEADVNINPNIKGASEETKNLIASLAEFNKKNGGFQISVGGRQPVMLSKLSKEDIDMLQPKDQIVELQTIAENTIGISETLKNNFNKLVQSLMPTLIGYIKGIGDYLIPVIKSITGDLSKPGAQGKVGSTLKGAGWGAGLGALAGAVFGTMVEPGGGTIFGAQLGSMLGTGVGGWIGSHFGGDSADDLIIPSNGGKPIFLNKKDDVFAMKPGGAIANAIMPRKNSNSSLGILDWNDNSLPNIGSTLFAKTSSSPVGVVSPNQDVNNIYGGVSKSQSGIYVGNGTSNIGGTITHNIQGSISLIGGNSSTKISASELIKDQQFVRELTRIIGGQANRDKNGGRYSGPLTNDSF
jgi:hypothetical protein